MRLDALFRGLFLAYCLEAGLLLLIVPWTGGWERNCLSLPLGGLEPLLFSTYFRAALSGFGLVHLVWIAQDIELWVIDGKRARTVRSGDE